VIEYGINDDDSLGVNIYSSKTRACIFKESKWGEGIIVSTYGKSVFLNGFVHMLEFSQIVTIDMEERHEGKFTGHVVMQSSSLKLRVSCVYVLLIFLIGMSFQSEFLKTMVLVNEH